MHNVSLSHSDKRHPHQHFSGLLTITPHINRRQWGWRWPGPCLLRSAVVVFYLSSRARGAGQQGRYTGQENLMIAAGKGRHKEIQ